MEYSISENRLVEIMKKFYEEMYNKPLPTISEVKREKYRGKSGYGSRMYDYNDYGFISVTPNQFISEIFLDEYGEVLFVEYSDSHYSDTKWYVDERFKGLYDFFGIEAFEKFVKLVYDKDITKKGNKKYNWLFY